MTLLFIEEVERLNGKRLLLAHIEEQVSRPHFCSENLRGSTCAVCGRQFGSARDGGKASDGDD